MLRTEQDYRLDQPSEQFCHYEATQRNSIVQHILVPLGSTVDDCTLCPHSVFMCFVWISEQIAIISLYSINWSVCFFKPRRIVFTARYGPRLQKQYRLYSVLASVQR